VLFFAPFRVPKCNGGRNKQHFDQTAQISPFVAEEYTVIM